jgi:putative ABC transport system permease protein
VQSAAAQDRFTLKGLKQFISIISIVLLTFGGVSIFVGAFTIFNTLAITVAQRSRELAMLRTVGASRGQVLGSVMVEALVIGAVAAIIGVAAGLGLATALTSVLSSLGLDLPQSGTVFAARTAIVGLLLGVVVTALAGIAPALGATKVPPVLAIREGVVADASSGGWATRVGIVTAVLSLVLLLSGMFAAGVEVGARFALIIPGCLLLFLAVALLSGRIASRLASVLGRPAERLGGAAGGLARLSAMRTPARTASTAAALMVGVALVVFVSTIGAGLRQSTTGTIEHQIKATYVVAADDAASPIDPGVGAAVRGAAGVGGTSSIAQDQVRAYGQVVALNGVEPGTIAGAYRYAWKQGSDRVVAGLSGDGAIVDQSFARAHHLSVGSSLVAHVASGGSLRLVVRGVDVPPKWGALGLGPITVSRATLHATFPLARDRLTFVTVGHADAATLGSLRARLSSYPGVKVMTPHAFATQQMSWIARVIAIVYVLLALAVIVSLLGIVNTLALSVFERTRELGMLRAIGMTRRQVRRMVRHESVIMALFGASVGIAVGLFLAAMVTVALRGQGLQFALPSASLVAFVVIAVAAGMLAAIGPARRAARLRVLDALAYE